MTKVRVFAYGSNLCIERIRARTPTAEIVATARLAGHSLRWHKRARDGSGKCDVLATDRGADLVWGAVYEVSPADKKALDGHEGLGTEYFEKTVLVRASGDVEIEALAYVANPRLMDPMVRPWRWYKGFVVTGAEQHGLPSPYRTELDAIESFDDPDAERHSREWAVLETALRKLR